MRRFARLLLASTLITLVLGGGSLFVSASASAQGLVRDGASEAGFLASINAQRAAAGLGPLTLSDSMTGAAAGWTEQMVNGSFLAHAGDIITGTPGDWSKVGENVGRGQSVSSLTQAFMASSGHRANILDSGYTHIGIAVYAHPTDGRLYTTHRFAALTGAAPAPAPTPAPPTPVPAAPTPVPVEPTPVPAQPTRVPPTPVPQPTVASQPTAVVVASATAPRPAPTAQPRPTAAANSVPAEQPTPRPQPTTQPSSGDRTPETVATSGPTSFGQAPEQLAFVDSETAARNLELKLEAKVAKVARGARSD